MKKLILIFVIAFLLNILWENLHSFLYDNYQGGTITEFILIRASLFDAFLILIFYLFIHVLNIRSDYGVMIIFGFIVAVLIEFYALGTGRWMYNEYMPIIPFLKIGLTPTIQLAVLGYTTLFLQKRFLK